MSAHQLTDKVVVITGVGSMRGQGAAAARLFAAEGARVVATDLPSSEGEATATQLGVEFRPLDVTRAEEWKALVEDVVGRHGRIDVLVNNAGLWCATPLLEMVPEEYDRVVAVNQTGVYLGIAAVAPVMRDQGSGSIVNTCSVSGMRGAGQPFAYAASKWAVRGMTRVAAHELAPHGVRVNAVSPGVVDTPMIHGGAEVLDRLAALVPMGRVAQPDEVAHVVLFLAGASSSYISGTEISVDAALTA
ncbi:SDR family NAD(P)-dependent oxidoreductase [Nocardioides marmoribigeumensis]|uniref:3alpha(Or 20beta)-hydroxysteroid dehydrogenase n=1 Tax=Nocardioides marmoribigeumensis TaxID=433649 RepID=A0ABU2BUX1_9ACTN|nr:SDR family NAD(P)-dependent oxidoreductase [Nocardioides marmoribigeumensis]MDR7362431.1 3alpha(or 20beta)-hydroxysteroid dehydrogenase [Nocardioides marmoribigeumensis]